METPCLQINYEKRKNAELLRTFQMPELTFLSDVQNYVPIYNRFFSLNVTNYNSINLNNTWFINDIKSGIDDNKNVYNCSIKNKNTNKIKGKEIFFKMAPLLDPFKYLVGKYDITDPKLLKLPTYELNASDIHPKFIELNNSAYVDGFFSFLSSLLIHKYNFIHGVDFYGSFLAIKNDFKLNIIDDLEYLCDSDFFNKNKNVNFQVEEYSHLLENQSIFENSPQVPLKIDHSSSNKPTLSAKSIHDDIFEDLFIDESTLNDGHLTLNDLKEFSIDLVDITNSAEFCNYSENDNPKTVTMSTFKSGSTCSSRTSHTSNDEETSECSNCGEDCDGEGKEGDEERDKNKNEEKKECEDVDASTGTGSSDGSSDGSDFEEERVDATIPKFPVHVICMENCEDTLDNLILDEELTQEEWFSALMQIIMILITYQKVFAFTHNDLHTNNVMYNETDEKYIYYCFKKKFYKVPTFGRIFKIIDFGRGIYKFDGKLFCSDSFQSGEDAATQYNIEPFFNEKKPRLEPNYSFDLCRLACSIFDYVVDDINEIGDLENCAPVTKLIFDWCLDDNGVNILYKNNGVERYPDFKLYKMIARCVHNHIPQAQLERSEFSSFCIPKNDVPKNKKVINIDDIPSFTSTSTTEKV